MTKLELTYPVVGAAITTEEPAVTTALEAIRAWANGNIDEANLKAEGIPESKLAKAVQEKLGTELGLKYETSAVSKEGASGKFYAMETAATTLTLPAPTANRMIGVINAAASGAAVKVTASAGKIYGDFIVGETTASLLPYQHLLLLATGTNWFIIAGEPKREQKYANKTFSKAEVEAGVEPSATRPAFVSGYANTANGFIVSVGGETAGVFGGNGSTLPTGFIFVPPGQKWSGIPGATVASYTILL